MTDCTPNPSNFGLATTNIARELITAGASPMTVAEALATSLGKILSENVKPEPAAAMLRIHAGRIEATRPTQARDADEAEMMDLGRRSHEFINTMQIAGIEERAAVSAILNTAIERVARIGGAASAAHWLRRMADLVDKNGDAIETIARAH